MFRIRRALRIIPILASSAFCTAAFGQSDSAAPEQRKPRPWAAFCTAPFAKSAPAARNQPKPRPWALTAEAGINSLASLAGPVVSFYPKPQLAVDLGAGLSSGGLRPGLRARYLFSREKFAY